MLPTDREQIQKDKTAKTYTPEELAKGVVRGDWAIEKVGNRDAVGEDAPFLKFVPEEKRVYGNNGCNALNAEYTYSPKDSTIRFSQAITTLRACSKQESPTSKSTRPSMPPGSIHGNRKIHSIICISMIRPTET